ncbi:MAG: hypothetical protein M1819_003071 [Sarea resinae]|nr:MAG: hypothetical protein M1819_003071 [Sarea resinae]
MLDSSQAIAEPAEEIGDIPEEPELPKDPPEATVARRAKSYSDFYNVVRAQIKKDALGRAQKANENEKPRSGIKTELDLGLWYQDIESNLIDASHEEYQYFYLFISDQKRNLTDSWSTTRLYRDQLDLSLSHVDSLLNDTSSTLDLLSTLSESFKSVEAQTTAFQSQCQDLLSEQQRITELANGINSNLQFYNYVEPITRRLNAPGAGNLVRGTEFSEMLSNLDHCLDYMQAHPNHREASIYRSRYRLLLTRGLTLIRVHFATSLREISSEVSKRIADRQLNETTMSALLYAKFRVGASELKQLAFEIQKRAALPAGAEPGAEAEYQSLMNELYTSYSATRSKLILPVVWKRIGEIAAAPSSAKDLVAFARSSIGYVRGVCLDEYDLWYEWFEGPDGLYQFLESVCEPLYDHLRPRTIHENQVLKLCELCTLLQTRYMHDPEDDGEPPEVDQLDFSVLIQPALEDAQTRLVFRTQAILRDEIENFKPKPEDLEYPILGRKRTISDSKGGGPALSGKRRSSAIPSFLGKMGVSTEDEDAAENREAGWGFENTESRTWYPTLKTAIWLLSRIYRLVNSTVFDDLAHQIVHQTTMSLVYASSQIANKATAVDGQLFLIKYFLILKQQIVAFDIEFVTSDVSFDFSGVTNTFWELRERGGLFNPRTIMSYVGGGLLPRVVENMLDAKSELDGRLRTVINEFTHASAARVTHSISASAMSKGDFSGAAAVTAMRAAAEKEVPGLRKKLDEYIDDVRTKETLVAAVQDQVMEEYDDFHEKLSTKLRANGQAVSKKGKGREDDIWDPDTFSEWIMGVFRVGKLAMQDSDEDGTIDCDSRDGST